MLQESFRSVQLVAVLTKMKYSPHFLAETITYTQMQPNYLELPIRFAIGTGCATASSMAIGIIVPATADKLCYAGNENLIVICRTIFGCYRQAFYNVLLEQLTYKIYFPLLHSTYVVFLLA